MAKLHIKKGDNVIVLAGEDKGKTGKVLKMLIDKQRAIVEGINIVSKSAKPSAKNPRCRPEGSLKSAKPSAKNPQGGIVKVEAPIHISNLSLIDPKTQKPTRIGIKVNEDGKKVRISKKSGEEIK